MNARYHRIDGWRGYTMPANALAGVSDTGEAPDSPCPTPVVLTELATLRRALRKAGIATRVSSGDTSNVFCGKHWITTRDPKDFAHAAQVTVDWLEEHRADTRFIHDADLDDLGFKPGGFDTESSASRQHFIDTGRYLLRGESPWAPLAD
jgi:hypothetical protein